MTEPTRTLGEIREDPDVVAGRAPWPGFFAVPRQALDPNWRVPNARGALAHYYGSKGDRWDGQKTWCGATWSATDARPATDDDAPCPLCEERYDYDITRII